MNTAVAETKTEFNMQILEEFVKVQPMKRKRTEESGIAAEFFLPFAKTYIHDTSGRGGR